MSDDVDTEALIYFKIIFSDLVEWSKKYSNFLSENDRKSLNYGLATIHSAIYDGFANDPRYIYERTESQRNDNRKILDKKFESRL
jgi:hypothetical protein